MNRNLIFELLPIPLFCLGIIMMLNTFYSITHAQVTNEPSVSITADVITGAAPLAVSFTSTVNDPFAGKYPITYDWHFDDGAASTKKNPQHTFTAAKTYTVTCKVTFWKSPKVTVQASVQIDAGGAQPFAVSVSGDPTSGNAPLAVNFTSTVTGGSSVSKIAYKWDFGDETTSEEINPTHTFNTAGTYKVTCTVTGGTPSQTAGDTIEIVVSAVQPIVLSVSANPTSGNAPLTVNFTSTVTGVSSGDKIAYKWDFGDETTSEEINPTHTFNTAGTYKVTCTLTGGTPSQTAGDTIEIVVTQTQASWPASVCTAEGDQSNPQITTDGSGGAIITWMDKRGGINNDIYARRISSTGELLWTADGVAICTAANNKEWPQITSDDSGGAIITWMDKRNGNNNHIYARRIDSAGNPLWTADGVPICTAIDDKYYPQITSDGSGGAIITWQDLRSKKDYDIYAQRIDGTGKILWTADGVAICTAANHQQLPQITGDGSGGAIITWRDQRSGNFDIYARRIDSTGKPLWIADGMPICTAANDQGYPQLTSDGSGGAIITWQDNRSGNVDIYALRINSAGNPQWTAHGVAICTAVNNQTFPQLTSDGSGGAIITWRDTRTNDYNDIYARRINSAGNPLWTANGVSICTESGAKQYPQIILDGSGGAFITWPDSRGAGWIIYAQLVNADGKVQWMGNGAALTGNNASYDTLQITSDGSGGAIIVWREYSDSTNYDIYAQRITKEGEVK